LVKAKIWFSDEVEVKDKNEVDWVLLAENVYIELDAEDLAAGVVKLDGSRSPSSLFLCNFCEHDKSLYFDKFCWKKKILLLFCWVSGK